MTPAQYESSTQKLVVLLTDFHAKQPRVALAPRASIASELKLPLADKQFSRWLEAAAEKGIIRLEKNGIALAQFTVQLNAKQHELLETILQRLNRDFLILPSETELATELKVPIFAVREILSLGEQSRKLVRITNEILMPTEMLERAKLLTKKLDEGSGFTAAQFRDASESSRKTVIPLLEYFDAQQFTVRLGDVRKVR
jgi:selenocysteine-specific elongation factor